MADPVLVDGAEGVLAEGEQLRQRGDFRGAIDRLTAANRVEPDSQLECKLVDIRLEAAAAALPDVPIEREAIHSEGDGGEIVEVRPQDMTVEALRSGWARSGCLLVRDLVPPDRAAQLISGIDSAFAAYDACQAGERFDPGWYTARQIRDRIGSGPAIHRINRDIGALWTVFSPRMVGMWFDAIEALGLGRLMTEFLGERPFLSANKCTLRRVPPADVYTGWHQDGAFLGDRISSVNVWMSLTPCGVDSPGLDVVPRRFDGVLDSGGDGAVFKWSLSDEAVARAAGTASTVRPQFGAGDVLLFDHRLVHRTASSAAMTRDRYAIESWFFAPSAYPGDQVPLYF